MSNSYKLLLIRFNYLEAKCLFPIILNMGESSLKIDEPELINKVIAELEQAPGISKTKIILVKTGTYRALAEQFDQIIGSIDSIDFNTSSSQIKVLSVEHRIFRDLTKDEETGKDVITYNINTMNFPVRVTTPDKFTLDVMGDLPLLLIE